VVTFSGSSNFLGMGRIALFPMSYSDNYTPGGASNPMVGSAGAFMISSQLPHFDIDYSLTDTYTLEVPFPLANGWIDTQALFPTLDYSLSYVPINPLRCANGATPPAITFNIFAYYENVEQRVLVPFLNQGELPSEFMGRMRSYSDALGKLGLDYFTTPVSHVLSVGEGVARFLGFSRPPEEPQDCMITRHTANFSVMGGQPTFGFSLGADTCSQTSIDKSRISLAHDNDTKLEYLIRKKTHLVTNLTEKYYQNIIPGLTFQAAKVVWQTPLSFVSSVFDYWSGDIEVCVQVVSSPLIRWRIGVVIVPPNVNRPTTFPSDGSYVTYIMETVGTTCLDIVVPYQYILPFQNFVFWPTGAAVDPTYMSLAFFSLGEPTGPSVTPVVPAVNLWIKGGDNFSLGVPTLSNLTGKGQYSNFINQGGEGKTSLSPGGNGLLAIETFGERFDDILLLTRRFTVSFNGSVTGLFSVPQPSPNLGSTGVARPNWTYMSYLRSAYYGQCGSIEYKVVMPSTSPLGVVCNNPSSTLDYGRGYQMYPIGTFPEFRIPYRGLAPFVYTNYNSQAGLPVEVFTILGGISAELANLQLLVAGGDDYIFGGFLFAPTLLLP